VILLERETENRFFGPNLGYVLELYEQFKEDPDAFDGPTREFFESWNPPRGRGTLGKRPCGGSRG
jgi:2-oxoglutarate dehydrogenase E1 component